MAEKSEDIFSGKSHQFFPGSFVCIFGLSGSGEYLYYASTSTILDF